MKYFRKLINSEEIGKQYFLFIILCASLEVASAQTGSVGVNTSSPQGVFHVDAGMDNNSSGVPTAAQQSNDFVVQGDGSVGVGTTSVDPSAILELKVSALSNKKGFLGPRVSLTSYIDTVTITSPAEGLLVYNLGMDTSFTYKGYVFWNGTEWRTLSGNSLAPGTISQLNCNQISVSPSTYTSGTVYTGSMTVPYQGGNGGIYPDQTIGPVNGLTATLSHGNFEIGAGNLTYTVTGIPTVTSPTTTSFTVSVGGQTCSAIIGAGDDVSLGELVYYRTDPILVSIGGGGNDGNTPANWLSNYQADLPVIGGKLRLDGYFSASATSTGSGSVTFNPRLVNISGSNVKFWFSAMTTVDNFNNANLVLAPNSWVSLDNGIYNGIGANSVTGTATTTNISANPPYGTGYATGSGSFRQDNTEVVTLDLSLDDKWYRVYYYPIIDNMDSSAVTANWRRRIYLSIQRLY
ncbi:hypothetical protein [Fluviicola sp.]|jgi:hypothetical protein|uniref:hypothetical protein n=1 Tax=Fluviicola sp. TaxID=1917219 RepID=UPI00282FF0CB|nr:hypothetical protein [Fluviicola sp.]MDR0803258.1 hypothetical protein [Fluviicola sp.]